MGKKIKFTAANDVPANPLSESYECTRNPTRPKPLPFRCSGPSAAEAASCKIVESCFTRVGLFRDRTDSTGLQWSVQKSRLVVLTKVNRRWFTRFPALTLRIGSGCLCCLISVQLRGVGLAQA